MTEDTKEFWRWKEYRWHDETVNPKGGETISAGVDVGSVSSQAVILVDGEFAKPPSSPPKPREAPGGPGNQLSPPASTEGGLRDLEWLSRVTGEGVCCK